MASSFLRTPRSPSLRTLTAHDGIGVGEIGNVCVVLWRGPVTRPRFDLQRAGLREVAKRNPEGAGFLCVIEPTSKPPDDQVRRASADMVRENEQALRGIACVVEGTGFVNAVARSAISAMALIIGPRRVPLTIVGTVNGAAAWLSPRVGVADVAALSDAVESMRASLQPWTPGAP